METFATLKNQVENLSPFMPVFVLIGDCTNLLIIGLNKASNTDVLDKGHYYLRTAKNSRNYFTVDDLRNALATIPDDRLQDNLTVKIKGEYMPIEICVKESGAIIMRVNA